MTKLIIQIPCYNEQDTLGLTLEALPKSLPGITAIETLIVDDGSTDKTQDVARTHKVHHIVRHPHNMGLAKAFVSGLQAALEAGADIIVNTDADNQYCADDIAALVAPIVSGKAEIVVGERPIAGIEHFSWIKKSLQRLGSWVVRKASGTNIPDVPSGFRAISRHAAMRLSVFDYYTYTVETIIQAGQNNIAITSVPIRVNPDLRPSRLLKNIWSYVFKSLLTIVRTFIVYQPMRSFFYVACLLGLPGLFLVSRFFFFYLTGLGQGHVQSVVIGTFLISTGVVFFMMGILADLVAVNRRLLEDVRYQLHRLKDSTKRDPSDGGPG